MVVVRLRTTVALLLALSAIASGAILLVRRSSGPPPHGEPPLVQAGKPASLVFPDGLLPAGAWARLEGHKTEVFRVTFTPDAKTVVTGGLDGFLILWDVATGQELLRTRRERKGPMYALAISPKGKTAATGDVYYFAACIWDLATGKEICTFQGHEEDVKALVYSPDGQTLISGGADQTVRFWEGTTGKELRKWRVGHFRAFALSPDGKILAVATAEEGSIPLYEVATGKELRRLAGHQVQINDVDANGKIRPSPRYIGNTEAVAFSPDGRTLASVGGILDCTVRLWDVATGKERLRLRAHEGQGDLFELRHELGKSKKGGNWVVFSPDGKVLASAGSDDKIILWDAATGKELGRFEGHKDDVFCVAFSPDGKTLASASADKTVLFWDATLRIKDGRQPPVHLEPKDVETRWMDLAAPEVLRASRAFWDLTAAPAQATPFLKERLHPVPHPDAERIARLMADLDSNQFQVREKATQELIELGEVAKPALSRASHYPPSVEVGSRVERILQKQREAPVPPEKTRQLRAVMVLENINTPEARQVLEALAKGAPGAALTREAKASLERLAPRSVPKP